MRSADLSSTRGELRVERAVFPTRSGLVGLHQRLDTRGHTTRSIVTGEAWVLSAGVVDRGHVRVGGCAGERFTMFFPPRSVTAIELDDASFTFTGHAGFGAPPCPHATPALLEVVATLPLTVLDLDELARRPLLARLDPDVGVAEPIAAARRLLHTRRHSLRPLADVAAMVALPPATLSRAFAAAYGMSPKQYVHRARVFDATLRLLQGVAVVESAFDSGFGDVSRFYRQFRRIVGGTPASYRRAAQKPPRPPR